MRYARASKPLADLAYRRSLHQRSLARASKLDRCPLRLLPGPGRSFQLPQCLDPLKPGADPARIWNEYNRFMRENGRSEEKRVHFHGQGYDMVERPLIRFDETMPIDKNMYFALHPAFTTERTYSWACDNFLLDSTGAVERLHQLPQRIFELG